MAKPDKTDNPNKAGGRANAPGQNKVRTFVNEAGETVEGTMNDFHATLKDQGYRPADDDDAEEVPAVEAPA
jgi:hypothetical protein